MTRRTSVVLLALCCGVTSANIYLLQPITVAAADHFGATIHAAGMLASGMQISYAIGIALFVPVLDHVSPRALLVPLTAASGICLGTIAFTGSWTIFAASCCLLGLFCPIPQIIIPAAVGAFSGSSARTVGVLQAGLLCGILFSRFYAGLVASLLSVQMVFAISCVLTVATGIAASITLPGPLLPRSRRPGAALVPGVALIRGLVQLVAQRRATRMWSIVSSGALIGVSFGMFWNSLTFFCTVWYGLSALQIGLFGIVAGASAALSPLAGRLSDRYGATAVQCSACALIVVGWICLLWGERTIGFAIAATILIDVGVWSNQVINQATLFADPSLPRGLANTVYFTLRFLGISVGSAVGATLFLDHHWLAAVIAAVAMTATALAIFPRFRPSHDGPTSTALSPSLAG